MDTRQPADKQKYLTMFYSVRFAISSYYHRTINGNQNHVSLENLTFSEQSLENLLNDAHSYDYIEHEQLLSIIYTAGCLYYNTQHYQKAADWYYKYIETANKLLPYHNHDKIMRDITQAYTNLCDCYFGLNHVDMAKKMIYEAIKAHRKITNQTESEKMISIGDDSSPEFLDQFRAFYERKTQLPNRENTPQFIARTNFLKKTYDATQFICDDINNLSLKNTTGNQQATIPSDSDLLQTAMQYQEYIKSIKVQLPLQKETEQEIEHIFSSGIKALKNISSFKTLSMEDKIKFNSTYDFLYTELGNWYFCQGKIELANQQWKEVIWRAKNHGESSYPFPGCEFFTASTLPFLTTNMSASELLKKQQMADTRCTAHKSNSELSQTALYAHHFIQLDMLLKRHHPSCQQGNVGKVLHCIASNYFNLKQFENAKYMYNRSIEVYAADNQLSQKIEDRHRRWLIETILDLRDCYKELYDYAGMDYACKEALSLFNQLENQTEVEKRFYRHPNNKQNENIKFVEFCKHFQQNTSSTSFLNSAQYNNSLAITQKIEQEPTVDDLMRQISSTCHLDEKQIAPIQTTGTNDDDLRTLATYYWQLANDMLRQPNNKKQQERIINALETAIQAMQKIQRTTKEDSAFLVSCRDKMQILQQPAARSTTAHDHVTPSQRNLATSAASSQPWQPTLFAQTTTTHSSTQANNQEENYSMQLN